MKAASIYLLVLLLWSCNSKQPQEAHKESKTLNYINQRDSTHNYVELNLPPPPPPVPDEYGVYNIADVMPDFPGGMDELTRYIQEHIQYPPEAKEQQIHGRVIVTFVIESNGSITNVEVIRTPNELLNAEAIRVIQSLPRFTPGIVQEEKVRVRYTHPVVFRL